MNALARTFPFTLLTLAAVFSFIAAAWLSVDAGWPVRLGLAALTLALWGIWFGVYRIRLRGEGEPGEQISPPDAARNRFMVLHVVFALTFVVAMLGGVAVIGTHDSPLVRAAATLVPAGVLLFWGWEFARMILRADEMMQAAHLRAVAIGAGIVLFGVSIWHLFATMAGLPEFPQTFLLPAFAVIYSIAMSAQGRQP